MNLETVIEKHALKNAIDHDGKANAKAVFPKVISEFPEVKNQVKEVMQKIELILKNVNKLGDGDQKIKLLKIDPSMLEKRKPEIKELKLENVQGKVVMRYAPNPNAGMHIGNARAALLNDFFVKKYGGKFILRYDDTDPKNENKKPNKQAYKQIENDLNWLGVEISEIQYASKRLGKYYTIFEELIKKSKAYICTCESEEWKDLRRTGAACTCRSNSIYENKRKWNMMLFGDFKQGTAVARLKTDMKFRDPAQRDWVCFRIVNKPNHPITKNKHTVWPLLDFASAVDDHDFGVTHILRGQDLVISERRQNWLYSYLHWNYPLVITYGHMGVEGAGTFSKSLMSKGITKKKYSGWNDPQLPMITSYARRGFHPESIKKMIIEIGLTGGKINISEDMLSSYNKKIIDHDAKRYFFVKNHQRHLMKDVNQEITVPNHPTNPTLGERKINVKGKVYISKDDVQFLKKTVDCRLIDFANVKLVKKGELKLSTRQEIKKEMQKIQWVSSGEKCEVINKEKVVKGLVEESVLKEKIGTVMQFVRYGFVRLDKKKPLTFVFAHK
ncbi:MAG: glutamate--tRNA ligase [Nanoarchaeota archaeon]|nr:glutamate--tRNA ligase [Nanoarchaeota archaeon]